MLNTMLSLKERKNMNSLTNLYPRKTRRKTSYRRVTSHQLKMMKKTRLMSEAPQAPSRLFSTSISRLIHGYQSPRSLVSWGIRLSFTFHALDVRFSLGGGLIHSFGLVSLFFSTESLLWVVHVILHGPTA